MTAFSVTYDHGADLLWVRKQDRDIHRSLTLGDLTVDFDTEGRVAGIELLNASHNMFFADEDIDAAEAVERLEQVSDAAMRERYTENGVFFVVQLFSDQDREHEVAMMTENAPAITA